MDASQHLFWRKKSNSKDFREELSSLLSKIDIVALWNFSHLHKVVLGILPLDLSTELRRLAHRSHIDTTDFQGRTALHWAASRGDFDAVQTLLLAGANQHLIDVAGRTALHFAVISGSAKCVDLLLFAGANVFVIDKIGDNPIMISAWANDCPEVINLLVSAGAQVTSRTITGVTPLQSAACVNHVQNASTFLSLGADPNASDNNGDSPLFETIYYGCMEVMDILLKQDIDHSHRNRNGWTVLHVLALYGTVDIMNQVVPYISGVDVAWRDGKGRRAIEALEDRIEADEEFRAVFQAWWASIAEDLRDEDENSEASYASALEMQSSSE